MRENFFNLPCMVGHEFQMAESNKSKRNGSHRFKRRSVLKNSGIVGLAGLGRLQNNRTSNREFDSSREEQITSKETTCGDITVSEGQSGWRSTQRDTQNTAATPASQSPDNSKLSVNWKTDIRAVPHEPVSRGGRVSVSTSQIRGKVDVFTIESGESVWEADSEELIEAPPVIGDSIFISKTGESQIERRAESSGRIQNEGFRPGALTRMEPTENALVVGHTRNDTYEPELVVLKKNGLKPCWTYQPPGPVGEITDLVVDDNRIYLCGNKINIDYPDSSYVASIEPSSREVLWSTTTGYPARNLVADGTSLYLMTQGSILSFSKASGSKDWRYSRKPGGACSRIAISDNRLVFGENTDLTAVSSTDGSVLWSNTLGGKMIAPSIGGGTVYASTGSIADKEAQLVSVEIDSGKILWKDELGTVDVTPPIITAGTVSIGTSDGQIINYT